MCSIDKNVLIFKFLLIGNGAVGKTSILQRLHRGVFTEETTTTVGIEFLSHVLNINDQKIKLKIWDTAGQERYQSLGKAYYRNAVGIIFVFGLDDLNSFEALDSWITKAQQYCHPKAQYLLVGNKSDMTDLRKVTKKQIDDFVGNHQIEYCETSAKTDSNISTCFYKLTEKVYQAVLNRDIIPQDSQSDKIEDKDVSKCEC